MPANAKLAQNWAVRAGADVGVHRCCYAQEYPFAMVADLDMESKMPGEFKWKSYLLQGMLYRDGERFSVEFGEPTPLYVMDC